MPSAGGIINIFNSGSIAAGIIILVFQGNLVVYGTAEDPIHPDILLAITASMSLLGILALAGGICAIYRRAWGLALAGSIASLFPAFFLGLFSIIFISLSRRRFK